MNKLSDLYTQALDCEAKGQAEAARSHYKQILTESHDYPNVHFRLGLMAFQNSDFKLAEEHFLNELEYRPDFWGCWSNLGLVYQKVKAWSKSEWAFEQALLYSPQTLHSQIKLNLLKSALEQNKTGFVLAELQHLPPSSDLNWLKGETHRQRGQIEQAIFYFEQALKSPDQNPQRYFDLGIFLCHYMRLNEAEYYFQTYLKSPKLSLYQKAKAHIQLAHNYTEQLDQEKALNAYNKAVKLAPHHGFKLAKACLLPPLYSNKAELLKQRNELSQSLQEWKSNPPTILNFQNEIGAMPFFLAYQGYNERENLKQWSQVLRDNLPPFPYIPKPSPSPQLKVGFVSNFFYEHSVMHTFERTIELFSEGCDVYLLSPHRFISDQLTQRLKQKAKWIPLDQNLSGQLQSIADLQLDVLIYIELGIDLNTYLLAHYRLANTQCVLPAHPITSGITESIDFFISTHEHEVKGAQDHYSEPLLLLNKSPSSYPRSPLPKAFKSRKALGLPEGPIYFCPVNLFKIHPDFDPVIEGILNLDPQGQIVFLERSSQNSASFLKKRLKNRLSPQAFQRVLFKPWFKPLDFSHALARVDVLLEPFPFGSYNTLFKAFAIGTPVIILETPYLRGRFGVSMYQQMELDEWVCKTPKAYIEQAVKLANNLDLRQKLKWAIQKKNPHIFEQDTGVYELIDFLKKRASKN